MKQPPPQLTIVHVPIGDIKPYWRNARDNTATIAALKKSIQEFGFNQPLVLDEKNVIIVGHARYRALADLGWNEVPCVYSDMTEAKAKQYRIADNRIHEQTVWDDKLLLAELREIGAPELMQPYFGETDLTKLLAESVGGAVEAVTPANVATVAEHLRNQHGKTDASTLVGFTCPHCLKGFQVNVKDLPQAPAA